MSRLLHATRGVAFALLLGVAAVRVDAGDPGPRTFPTPEAAARAVAAACEADDAATLVALLGAGSEDLVTTGDPTADRGARRRFAALARQAVRAEPSADGATTTLVIGHGAWPFPVPLVREGAAWRFDAAAARAEILARRIGEDELAAIALLRAYGPAQRAYAAEDRDGDGCLEFARRLRSSEGARDGLWWPTKAGEPPSPFGPMVAAAGVSPEEHVAGDPWKGYRFRVLTRQGDHAPGGAFDYAGPRGDLIGGAALVAWPATYRVTGVMTFVVGREGRVYQKDLGADTSAAAGAIAAFDPDPSWREVTAD